MKKYVYLILGLVLLFGGIAGFFIFQNREKVESFNSTDKKWIQENKNSVLDMVILNQIPLFTASEEGLLFNFIDSFEEVTELSFNRVPFSEGLEMEASYRFVSKAKADDKDIVMYEDNYVILAKDKTKYLDIAELLDLRIAVLDEDFEKAQIFLRDLNLVEIEDYDSFFVIEEEGETEGEEKKEEDFDAIVVPKLMLIEKIMQTEYNIVFDIADMKLFYVIELDGEQKLNDIIKKYYSIWYNENYVRKFNENFNQRYFSEYRINEKEQTDFRSKKYNYGYYNFAPYDFLIDQEMVGINVELLNNFSKMTDVEFNFIEYKSQKDLNEAVVTGEVDLIFYNQDPGNDLFFTVPVYSSEYVVISHFEKNTIINSVSSLINESTMIIDDQQLIELFDGLNINYQKYDYVTDIPNNAINQVIVLDKISFQFYREKKFKNYKMDYIFKTTNDVGFVLNNNPENKVFNNYFNFYLSFVNNKKMLNDGFVRSYQEYYREDFMKWIIGGSVAFGLLLLVITLKLLTRKGKKMESLSNKESRLKYIDLLTSLKNRHYLNEKIKVWDNSGIYPQAIIIVDLNNVAYINDNYGHAEGDELIKEAANILILNQEENSDIIRTSGNEFLIYLVNYDEKQVGSYAKKVQKEFENLKHGFGAAVGYSVIEDEIKTIDDAINEATIDMRNKKVIE